MLEQQTGVVNVAYIAQAVRYATRMGANVINISLSTVPLLEMDVAVDAAIASGITVVVGAGNNGSPHGLSERPGLVYVAATDRNDAVPVWSNHGSYVDLCAPGADLTSTNLIRTGTDSLSLRQPGYVWGANGTSFATALTSGAVALVQAYRKQRGFPLLPPEQARLQLITSCDDIAAANPDLVPGQYGAGRLNLARALALDSPLKGLRLGIAGPAPVVDFETLEGERRLALVTSAAALEIIDAQTLARAAACPLGIGPPEIGLSAADLGGGRGLGFFVSSHLGYVGGYGGGGQPLPGWPVRASRGPLTVPALGDLDGDGSLDVVCVGPDAVDPARGLVWAWTAEGLLRSGFPIPIASFAGDSVGCALADLDGNPGAEIVVAEGDGSIHALRADGTELPGWPVQCPSGVPAAPVVGRGASSPLVWVATRGRCYALTPTGTQLISSTVPSSRSPFDPLMVDLDGDGTDDLVVSTRDMTYARYFEGAPAASSWPVLGPWVGAPLAGHLSAGAPSGVLGMTEAGARAMTLTGSPIEPFNGGGLPIITPTLGAPIVDDRTTVFTGLAPTGWLFAYAAPPGSWSDAPQAWPTQRGNFARTGSQLGAPRMARADDRAPQTVGDLAGTALSATRVRLVWTSPTDDSPLGRAVHYDLRIGSDPITPTRYGTLATVASEGSPRPEGAAETLVVQLPQGWTWFARLRATDGSGNWSDLSNQASFATPSSSPAAVRDLRVTAASETTLALEWTATGGDQDLGRPSYYDVRASLHGPDRASYFDAPFRLVHPATTDAGGVEAATLGGLPSDAQLFVAVRAVDEQGNSSQLSNSVTVRTRLSSFPDAVRDLKGIAATESTLTLSWTATGDDQNVGRPDHYEIRAAYRVLSESDFDAAPLEAVHRATTNAGGTEIVTIGPYAPDTTVWVAIKAVDGAGNVSPISNVIEAHTLEAARDTVPIRFDLVLARNPARPPVRLSWWTSTVAGGSPRIEVHDLNGRALRRVALPPASAGIFSWNGDDDDGRPLAPGVYFLTLTASGTSVHRKLVLLRP
jgi:hypothetical protein